MSGLREETKTYSTFFEAIEGCDASENLYAVLAGTLSKNDPDQFKCSDADEITDADKYIVEVNSTMLTALETAFGGDNSALDNFCVLAGRHIGKVYRYSESDGECKEGKVNVLVTDEKNEDDTEDVDDHQLDVTEDEDWTAGSFLYTFDASSKTVDTPEMVFISPNGTNNANALLTGKDSDGVEKDLLGLLCGDDMKFVRKYYYADKAAGTNPGKDLVIKECNPDAEKDAEDFCKKPEEASDPHTIATYDRFQCAENSSSALLSAFMLVTSLSMFLF